MQEESSDIVNISAAIRRARETKRVRSKEVAKHLGLLPSAYSQRETGVTEFTAKEVHQIAHFLEVPISRLYGELNLLEDLPYQHPALAKAIADPDTAKLLDDLAKKLLRLE